jgi:hypothetical protein
MNDERWIDCKKETPPAGEMVEAKTDQRKRCLRHLPASAAICWMVSNAKTQSRSPRMVYFYGREDFILLTKFTREISAGEFPDAVFYGPLTHPVRRPPRGKKGKR